MLENIVDQVLAHAKSNLTSEICGLAVIVRGKLRYYPCENELSNDSFCISAKDYVNLEELGEIVGVCHSHVNSLSTPSEPDIIACDSSRLPWLIVSTIDDSYTIVQPKATQYSLIGRKFYHNVHDCFALARDYYKTVLNIHIPDFHRPVDWWLTEQNIILDNFTAYNFVLVNNLQPHDVIIMQVASKVPNHIAIYLGDDRILHHCINRLSSRDWYDARAQRVTKLILRHKDLM